MNLNTIKQDSAVSIPLATVIPRFGTPGNAALFVGQDLYRDYFYFPLSLCAVIISGEGERLLTQFEETAKDAAQYDFTRDLYELTTEGVAA
jgi:hypothetical protein